MDAEEIGRLIGELENRVERLRSLYEQYFMGIERLEPLTVRKDIDRRLWALRREQIRNTGLRFKLETTIQRYNTYQQYWARIVREIEQGTYQRDLGRAAQRFGDNAVTGLAKRRQKMFEKNIEKQAERNALRAGPASQAPPDEAVEEAPPSSNETYDVTFEESEAAVPAAARSPHVPAPEPYEPLELEISEPAPPPPRAGPPAPARAPGFAPSAEPRRGLPAAPLARPADSAVVAPPAVAARPPAAPLQRPAPPAPPAGPPPYAVPPAAGHPPVGARPAAPGGPPLPPPRPPLASSSSLGKPAAPPVPSKPVVPVKPAPVPIVVPTKPATPFGTPAKPAAAFPKAPPSPPSPVQTVAAAPRPAVTPTAKPAAVGQPGAAPAGAKPTAPAAPQPAVPAVRPPAPSRPDAPGPAVLGEDNSLSPIRMRQIYGAFVEAKRRANESTATVTYEKIASNLENVAKELRAKHKARSVDFEVVLKNGKPVLKPVVKG